MSEKLKFSNKVETLKQVTQGKAVVSRSVMDKITVIPVFRRQLVLQYNAEQQFASKHLSRLMNTMTDLINLLVHFPSVVFTIYH